MINPKYTVKNIAKFDLAGRIGNLSTPQSFALAGASLGTVKTVSDKTDDTLGSTAVNLGVGAGGGLGVMYAAQWLDKQKSEELVEQADKKAGEAVKQKDQRKAKDEARKVTREKTKITVSRMQAEEIKQQYQPKVKARQTSKKMDRWLGYGKLGGIAGLGAFALASVMDTSEGMAEESKVSRMVNEQEKNLARKQTRESRNQDKLGYGHVDMGQMAIDLFNERMGHHKMGNAKFQ